MKSSICLCHAMFVLFATSALFAETTPLTLYTASSEPFTAYVAGPKEAHEGIVLVHDRFGVAPFYMGAAEELAERTTESPPTWPGV
jgi:hypothetical protein